MNERKEFWIKVFVALIQSGKQPIIAALNADKALVEFDHSFPVSQPPRGTDENPL